VSARPHVRVTRPLLCEPGEDWIELPGDPRYLISTAGRLYSTMRRLIIVPQMLGTHRDRARLHWRIAGRTPDDPRRWVGCAHYVLLALGPPPPDERYVAKCLDGDQWHVRLDNLGWRVRRTPEQMAELARLGNAARWGSTP
jgi:hypothetical protein